MSVLLTTYSLVGKDLYAQRITCHISNTTVGGVLLSSCTPGTSLIGPTLTPTSTYTPSPTVCPPIDIATPGQAKTRSYLVIALFEDNPEHREYTLKDIELLKGVLEEYAEPGDYINMLRMEPLTLESATFVSEKVGALAITPYPPLPTSYPTSTPYPPLSTTPSTTIGQTAVARDITATAQVVYATATHAGFLHNCALKQWDNDYSKIKSDHETAIRTKRLEFTQRVSNDVTEGLQENPISRTSIWYGLAYASTILENECKKYDRCFLFVFSDMVEIYKTPPTDLIINLKSAEVLITMRNCTFLFSADCGVWTDFWKQYLTDKTKTIDIINENASEVIEALLRR